MVDTLAIYVPNRCPALAQLYRSLEPMVVSLMLGDNLVSEDQLNISLEKVLENEAHKSRELEMLQIPGLESLSRSVGSRLIHTQRTQAMVNYHGC
jgi:hypothetical protein